MTTPLHLETRSAMVRVLASAAMVALTAGALPLQHAWAATITVDRGDDTAAASACTAAASDCSLRGAIAFANANTGTLINVPDGTYMLTLDALKVGTVAGNITSITGAGPATTIIQQSVANRRVLNINPNVLANVVVSISGVRITGGNNPSDHFGGGGLIAGGAGHTLNLSNCIIDGNVDAASLTPKGGGIEFAGGGTLNIDHCVISNNTAGSAASNLGSGGGVDFQLLNNAGAAGQGGLNITHSAFTGNKAGASNSGAGGALRLAVTTTQGPPVIIVNNNTFTGNQANAASNGLGGAISSSSSAPITARFNRIVGNTATGGATGMYQATGTIGTINATHNWWGCNTGPGTPGCDSVGGVVANIATEPRLVLNHTASPGPLSVNQTTLLTASFRVDSSGVAVALADISRLIELPISFSSAVSGALSSAQITLQADGTATASFTASAAGSGSAAATVDSGAATANITINKADTASSITAFTPEPSVTGQAVTVFFGATSATGSVPTAPSGTVTVTDGTSFCTATVTTGQCTLTMTNAGARNVTATYAGDTNFNGSTSATAAHIIHPANTTTTITLDSPDPSTVDQAVSVTFKVMATAPSSGTPTGNVAIVGDAGVEGCTGTVAQGSCPVTFNITGTHMLTASYAGDTNYNGSVSPDEAHVVVGTPASAPSLVTQPNPQTVCEGSLASFSATANGSPTPTMQWQFSSDGGSTWNNIAGATTSPFSFSADAANTGRQYRARFTNSAGSTNSNAAMLTVNLAPSVNTQPSDQHVAAGQTATFSATASGTPAPVMQWQSSTNGGVTWNDIANAATPTLDFVAQVSDTGKQYRATFTNSCATATTNAATLTVTEATSTITLTTTTLPFAIKGTAYNQRLSAAGGQSPYTFTVSADSLPPGLSLTPTGVITGTPTAIGPFTFTVQVKDANGMLGSQMYTLNVIYEFSSFLPLVIKPLTAS